MNRGFPIFVLAALLTMANGSCLHAQTAAASDDRLRVATLELREDRVTSIPTHPNVTLFLQFPLPIEDYTGRGFTEDPATTAGDFVVRHIDGDAYLSLSPLTDSARRILHVVCGGKGYPIQLFPAEESAAWDKVIFVFPEGTSGGETEHGQEATVNRDVRRTGVRRSPHPPAREFKSMGTERALGVIDTLRLLANLPAKKAKAVVAANPALAITIKENRQDCGDYLLTTHFVLRDNIYDCLGFALTLDNKSADELRFVPGSLTVRAGAHVYPATAADMNPIVAPGASTAVFLVLAGDGFGGWNHLAGDNDFRVSLDLAGRKDARPTSSLAIPEPPGGGERSP